MFVTYKSAVASWWGMSLIVVKMFFIYIAKLSLLSRKSISKFFSEPTYKLLHHSPDTFLDSFW